MESSSGQSELFIKSSLSNANISPQPIPLTRENLVKWQIQINNHQEKLFTNQTTSHKQVSLFQETEKITIDKLDLTKLTPLPLSFWRWPNSPHKGPAIYLVMDKPKDLKTPLLLYVGETFSAEKRWKGEHDCKEYLSNYAEALYKAGLTSNLSIRFWADVPKSTKARRNIEQQLIQRWLPPFNKETRARWSTPFTADIH